MDMRGQRVLITGASQGLGEALAREFAGRGAEVALAARSASAIEALAIELRGTAYTVDLSDGDQVDGFIERVEMDGQLDILVNNAGMGLFALLDDTDASTIDQLTAVNLTSPLKLCAQILPGMIARGSGRLVQIASLGGILPMAATSVYAASKAGLIAASANLQIELQGTGVGVTTVHLGAVDTVMAEDAMTTDALRPYFDRMDKIGMTKRMDPAKAAGAIVDGVVKEKRDLVVPKNGLPVTGLSNVPRRMGRLLARGLPVH